MACQLMEHGTPVYGAWHTMFSPQVSPDLKYRDLRHQTTVEGTGTCSPSRVHLLYHTGYWLYFYMYNAVEMSY